VLDVGKTHAKLSLVRPDGTVDVRRRIANTVRYAAPYPHADVGRLFDWICAALRETCATQPVDRMICTTHGATAALVSGNTLALPVMDYEWPGFPGVDAEYERLRDSFQATLSPGLPAGLNLARQIYWQSQRWPDHYAQVDRILLERRMSLTDLSERVGVTLANLSILKTGKAKAVRFSTLNALCRVLQCQPGELLAYEPSENDALEEAADKAAE